ncbi:MAG: veratrol--corrinoid protein metyltransferase, partial [Coriobacteriia bacterium]|nr:veratrol--corrinoid protein metyltransferase [Coriobacteriia bacterium]
MATLTPKENIMRVLTGQIPEWVPSYSYYGPLPGVEHEPPPNMGVMMMQLFGEMREDGSFTDLFGVPYTAVEEVGGFSLPTPNEFILKDITKWRDVVKIPERLKDIDWKAAAEEAVKTLPYDREQVSVWWGPGGGYFMQLMNLMGFTEGLVAMYEEPDEVKELFQFLFDFHMGIATQIIDIIKPDVMTFGDDAAAERAPFISPEMYREFLIPFYRESSYLAVDRGLPINMHLCGKGDVFIPDLIRIGVNCWEPVQLANDIEGLQARYGRHLVIGGGWEGRGRLTELDVTDEEIRQSVRDSIDKYASNGGFMFAAAYTPMSRN